MEQRRPQGKDLWILHESAMMRFIGSIFTTPMGMDEILLDGTMESMELGQPNNYAVTCQVAV